MDELTFITLAAKEVINTSNDRLKAIYEWSRAMLIKQGSCGGVLKDQELHASVVACDILLRVGLLEESGEYITAHSVDSILNENDFIFLRYYYKYENNSQVTISVAQCSTRFYSRIPNGVEEVPLVLQLTPRVVEEATETESAIILPT